MSVLKTLILCIAACLTVRCTRWYYRIGQGPVFGPYNEGLLRQWRTDGYFNDANIYVSHEDSPERFLPFETSIRGSLNTRTTKFVKDKMRKLFKSANRRFAPVVASSDIAWPGGNRAQTGAQNQGSESDQHFEIGPETDTGKPTEHVAAPLDIAAVVSEERAMQVPSGMSTEAAAIHPDGGEVLDVDETVLLSQLKRDATPKPDRQSSSVEVVHNEPQQQPQQFSLRGLGNHESSAWEPRHVKHNGVLHPSSVDDEKLPLFQGAVQEAAATSVVVLKRMVRLIAMIFPPVLQQAASHIVGLGSRPGGVSVLLLLLVYGAVQVIRAALNLSLLATVYAVVISMVPSSTRQTSIVKLSNYVNDAHIHTAELGAVPASLQSTRPLLTDLTKQVLESVRKALQLLRSVNSGSVPSRKGVISGCRDVSRLVYASAVQHWATLRPQLCALGSRPVQLALVLSLLAVLNVVILPRLNAAITARVQPTGVSNEATSDAGAAIVYVRLSAGLAFSLTATAAFVWHLLGSVNDARLPAMQWIALPLSVATVLSTIESYGAQAPRYNRDQRQSMERGAEEHDLDERKALRRVRDRYYCAIINAFLTLLVLRDRASLNSSPDYVCRMLDVEALVKILSRPDALLECEASELSTYASDFVRHAASRLQQAMHKLTAAANSDRLDSPVVRTRFATVRRVVLSALVAVISLLVWSRSDVHHAGGQALWSFMAKRIGSNPLYRACVPRVWNALDATSRMLRDGVCGPLATDPVLIAASPVHAVGTELLLPGIVLVAPTWLLQRHLGVLATLELDTAQSDRGVASRERSQATFAASHLRRVESALQAAMAIAERLCRPHLPSQSEASPAGSTRNGGVELRLSLDNEKVI